MLGLDERLLDMLGLDERLGLGDEERLTDPALRDEGRCANVVGTHNANAIAARMIAFEVFIFLLLLSFFGFIFWCKDTTIP